jgi:hypothetical protein
MPTTLDEMEIVRFYKGMCGNNVADTLEDVWTWSHGKLEMDHDWIQWAFPSNEPSKMNSAAPTLSRTQAEVFKQDAELQQKVKKSFLVFLDFLGLKMVRDDEVVEIVAKDPSEDKEKDPLWWTKEFNHNMLRVTRVLKSLRLTGHQKYADALFKTLLTFKDRLSANSFRHWTRATFDDLWE